MLREALKEPRNQRFLMLSDSGVPLYPPTVVWQQLVGESKSRIDACNKARRLSRDMLCVSSDAGQCSLDDLCRFFASAYSHAHLAGETLVGVEPRPEQREQLDCRLVPHFVSGA